MSESIGAGAGAHSLPVGWRQVRLKYVSPISNEKLDEKPVDLPYIGLEHITPETGAVNPDFSLDQVASTVSLFGRGDVLFGKLRPYLCKVVHADLEGVCTTELVVLKPKHIKGRYLFYQLLSPDFIHRVNALTYGAKMPRVGPEAFGNLTVILPASAEEQQAIVECLDRKTAKIDEIIALKEEQVHLLEVKRRALISHAVTGGLDPNAPTKPSGVEWIDEVPAHWTVRKLKWIARTESGSTPTSTEREMYYDGDTLWVRTTDINDGPIHDTPEKITDQALEDYSCNVMPKGTVLVAMYGGRGTIGKTGLLMTDAATNQALCSILPNGATEPRFLQYYLRFYRPYWMADAVSTRKDPNISQELVRDLAVPLPPPEEQATIADHLDQDMGEIDSLVSAVREQVAVLRTYRQAVISAAVTGQLNIAATT